MGSDSFSTQRDVGSAVVTELRAAGFADAVEIGRGGFGIVYRCTQVALDRTVAIKVVTREPEENRERFLREQRVMGRLTGHPNIVGVLHVGETGSGYLYLVMQYHQRGSLHARIQQLGRLPADEVLRTGVKLAGALESAHRLGVLHRDVKPGNILLTDYGEPALSDFGIAHVAGGFMTKAGTFTGSPAFTAPEILTGDPATYAADVYGLGATLFSSLTGHAAYQRRSGEEVIAQFLRIAAEPVPDLREQGIPDEISAVVEQAMARDPQMRPEAWALGEELRRAQARLGLPIDEMALRGQRPDRPASSAAITPHGSDISSELTSFIGRDTELAELINQIARSRLVTVTGIGGVGKTRLAMRAATQTAPTFPDGVRIVELGELRDGSQLASVIGGSLHLRDDSARSLHEELVAFLTGRRLLLVLDNCEQVVDSAATLIENLLRACPNLHILVTSRERLGVGGESVVPLSPLSIPADEFEQTLGAIQRYDSIALFRERAAEALPGFTLTVDNKTAVAKICNRLDGLPLAIELAAARLRVMSVDQILEGLADRYALLTRGNRGVPNRQQTLGWSIGWSYDLCTPAERRLWCQLSVFTGSFELQAAQHVCSTDFDGQDVLDVLSSLVDKSILSRTAPDGIVRFRLLDTLRDYGRQRLQDADQYVALRRRHANWYGQLIEDVAAEWFGPRQIDWIRRLAREMPNLREAIDFALIESPHTAVKIVAALWPIWAGLGMVGEGRRWLDRALSAAPPEATPDHVRALASAAMLACMQRDPTVADARAEEARGLAERVNDAAARGMALLAVAFSLVLRGEHQRAAEHLEQVLSITDDPTVQVLALTLLGWTLEFRGDINAALVWQEKAVAFAQARGESMNRSYALWAVGIGWWRHGNPDRAKQLLTECLQLTRVINDPRNASSCLEALAWVADASSQPRRAAVLLGAASALGDAAGVVPAVLPDLTAFHDDCERSVREALGVSQFDADHAHGAALSMDEAVDYASATRE
jgi:non-specific serine/threonine protein kinase